MLCIMCFKKAEVTAYGNSYCMKHFKESPYYAETLAKERLENEKKERRK